MMSACKLLIATVNMGHATLVAEVVQIAEGEASGS